jgi:orotidine-5'-phosphate decarboxylase
VTPTLDPAGRRRAKDALALALDVDDGDVALALAARLDEWFGVAKVGLELYCAAGPDVVHRLVTTGYEVFLDLKLHDIPTTVRKAACVVGRLGVSYVTVHTAGGAAMLRAAAEGLADGARDAGRRAPIGLGVTVLTSDPTPSEGLLVERVALARDAGLGGVVCAAPDLPIVRRAGAGLVTVVPGTREPTWSRDDQLRVTTPAEAIALGADVLVIGRGVTAAGDPDETARSLVASVTDALGAVDAP